jgi:hypothetical protein
MDFKILGLAPTPFVELYGLTDAELEARHAKRYIADKKPGFPDRVEMRDVEPGEVVILVNYEHQAEDTPYRARHAVFVREGAVKPYEGVNEVPAVLKARPISLRAFDDKHWMIDAKIAEGAQVEESIRAQLANPNTAYIQAHFASRGCYAARIERV